MTKSFSEFCAKEFKPLSETLTAALKKDAAAAGWPANIAQVLEVIVNAQGISVTYPESMATAVEDLEYGTPGAPAKAVFRLFTDKHETEVSNALVDASFNFLFEGGDFL